MITVGQELVEQASYIYSTTIFKPVGEFFVFPLQIIDSDIQLGYFFVLLSDALLLHKVFLLQSYYLVQQSSFFFL